MLNLRLALRMLRRDWRAGELSVLGLALVLAVAALTSVSFLSDRVLRALEVEAHQLLGGDLLLTADHPWPDAMRSEAVRLGLQVAESLSFPSMVMAGEGAQLAEIKAVSDGYPLRGALRIAPALNQADSETRRVPQAGEAWADERLASALAVASARVPETPLRLGAISLKVGAVLTVEPDRGLNLFALAPRLMIHLSDVAASGLIQPGSRVSYRLHLAGNARVVAAYADWATPRLGRGERLEGLDNARPEVRVMMERAERFMRLAALLAVVLAAVAVGLAAERYLQRHLDGCAVMRCLGASEAQVLAIHGGEFLLFGLAASVLGCLLGYAVQLAMQAVLSGLLFPDLPAPSWRPAAHGLLVGLVLVGGFALPPLLRLKRVPTVRVLRREWEAGDSASLRAWLLGALMLAALMWWIAGETRLWLVVLGGFACAFGLYAIGAKGLLAVLARVRPVGNGYGWRHGLINLRRHHRASLIQIVALGMGLTALLLLTVARGDLMDTWRNKTPPDAPNRFVINIQPDQRDAVSGFFIRHALPLPDLLPMVRGRLVSINDKAVSPKDWADERAQRLVDREFNLSWMSVLPAGNAVSAGRWFAANAEKEFSVERGLAETLGLKLGDRLGYEIAGRRFEASISSLRTLDWDSMRVNFFVIAPPAALSDYPASFISSFRLPPGREALGHELVREFPNLTLIDVSSIARQVQSTLDQVSLAVQLVFGFAVLAGLAVLWAALQASGEVRRQEAALLRALGAQGRQITGALAAEFISLGALAGSLAGLGASLIGWALARFVFQLDYWPNPLLLASGIIAGMLLVGTAAVLGIRPVLRQSPLSGLRGDG